MSFTGKATYTAGPDLPETHEDVSDIISIVSPHETPLLDHLGDPQRSATATVHEWLEDELLPNTDSVDDASFSDPAADVQFNVAHGDRFCEGDQIQIEGSREVMLVTAVNADTLTVIRGYGNTTPENLADGQAIRILGNAALEGDDRPDARFTTRVRRQNYTQIFTASVEVSGSQLAARQIGLADELDYQKQERLRELIRDLENCVLNGVAPASNPQGSATVRRTMKGIIPFLATNQFVSGSNFPAGDTVNGAGHFLNEEQINAAMRLVWQQSAGHVDTIVVNGFQKRRINAMLSGLRGYTSRDTQYRDLVATYESDFGICRVVLSRWMPADTVLLLDSSRVSVLPMTGRSFHFKKLASTGDSDVGQLIGEYTLELRNESAHGIIRGLQTSIPTE